ncbi:hypothetical protein SKAU_G00356730 [Synaphobranchus kaupii]|uniref:Uncharacterized protein n=1 Tax=Synaphobranchus kaupii TaxID=118154 RepID=A0A9Q1EHK3_SYNKA|nr:hypothetical protein SKAU_G00356730 [Synaphobranchus kaupii]
MAMTAILQDVTGGRCGEEHSQTRRIESKSDSARAGGEVVVDLEKKPHITSRSGEKEEVSGAGLISDGRNEKPIGSSPPWKRSRSRALAAGLSLGFDVRDLQVVLMNAGISGYSSKHSAWKHPEMTA